MNENEKVFNVKEAADYLKCSQSTIRKLLRNKAIPSYRVAQRIFFKKSLIDLWINNQCIQSCEVMRDD